MFKTVQYQNLLENTLAKNGAIICEPLLYMNRLWLKAGQTLPFHQSASDTAIICLRGKAQFQIEAEHYVLHPGSLLELPANTPHGVIVEIDCVLLIIHIH